MSCLTTISGRDFPCAAALGQANRSRCDKTEQSLNYIVTSDTYLAKVWIKDR